ncbi:MAG TPA: hypothetical protein V6C71_26075 [Coleofasciculaceae cyanobacterium]|jgi:phosphotransacetylase
MKETFKDVKIGEISNLISKLGLSSEQVVNITIEQTDTTLTDVLDRLGKNAQKKGLTAEKLNELLADES